MMLLKIIKIVLIGGGLRSRAGAEARSLYRSALCHADEPVALQTHGLGFVARSDREGVSHFGCRLRWGAHRRKAGGNGPERQDLRDRLCIGKRCDIAREEQGADPGRPRRDTEGGGLAAAVRS